MEAFAARPTLDQLVDGVATQIANAFVGGFLDLGLTEQSKSSLDLRFVRDLVSQISTRTRAAGALPVAVGGAVLGRRRQRRGRLLPLRRPAAAVHPGRAGERGRQLHRRPPGHRGRAQRGGAPQARVPRRQRGRHRQAGPGQRRDDLRLRRQRAGHLPGLRPHAGAAADRLPAHRQAAHAAGHPHAEPVLVDRGGHPGHRPPLAVLGGVHLDRHRDRHRLRRVPPVPLRGGAVPRPESAGGAGDHGGPDRPRRAARAPSPPPPPSTCCASPTSAACRSWGSSPAPPSCSRGS